MLIEKIIDNDLDSCQEALKNDIELKSAEKEFYTLLGQMDNSLQIKLEEVFSNYSSRAIRIAYVKGFKEFLIYACFYMKM